jgi:hypothetical protein
VRGKMAAGKVRGGSGECVRGKTAAREVRGG